MRGGHGGLAVLLVAGALSAAIGLQVARDRLYPRDQTPHAALLYVRSGEAVGRLVLAFDALAADVYWIRALQHYGGDRLSRDGGDKYELLYPLLDLTTSLDPYFTIAYRFGAIFLSEPPPGGPGRADQAIWLLRKGIAAEPRKWEYYHDIGFVYYWQLREMEAAARWFRRAAEQPGAPNWLEPLAASVLVKGGDRASARFLLQQIVRSEEAWIRGMAARALLQVDALDMIDALERLVARVSPPPGEPYSWGLLIRRGLVREIPVDPTGAPFQIDPETGAVSVAATSDLHPMPTAFLP